VSPDVVQGLWLLVVGMTTVFAFLGVLVVAMNALAALVARFPEDNPAPPPPPRRTGDDAEIVAVLVAAVAAHRARETP
jgi:oxaloacetate decarboxylase gamma subunit